VTFQGLLGENLILPRYNSILPLISNDLTKIKLKFQQKKKKKKINKKKLKKKKKKIQKKKKKKKEILKKNSHKFTI